ncbi:MAG: response regulator [Desulfobacteraceae bacterium]|nr:MAG: response regulator [Desulfobacteraceae bacterium]
MINLKKKPKCVLVVDDDEKIRCLISELLKNLDYEVTCAVNGQDALQIYQRGHFDIVLSDLMMKPMDGLELLNKIKEINPAVIFIIITGYPSIKTTIEAIRKGANDYITKPFNIDEINMKIERALLERSLHERLKNIKGIVWALIISIPVWLILGIILASVLRE